MVGIRSGFLLGQKAYFQGANLLLVSGSVPGIYFLVPITYPKLIPGPYPESQKTSRGWPGHAPAPKSASGGPEDFSGTWEPLPKKWKKTSMFNSNAFINSKALHGKGLEINQPPSIKNSLFCSSWWKSHFHGNLRVPTLFSESFSPLLGGSINQIPFIFCMQKLWRDLHSLKQT